MQYPRYAPERYPEQVPEEEHEYDRYADLRCHGGCMARTVERDDAWCGAFANAPDHRDRARAQRYAEHQSAFAMEYYGHQMGRDGQRFHRNMAQIRQHAERIRQSGNRRRHLSEADTHGQRVRRQRAGDARARVTHGHRTSDRHADSWFGYPHGNTGVNRVSQPRDSACADAVARRKSDEAQKHAEHDEQFQMDLREAIALSLQEQSNTERDTRGGKRKEGARSDVRDDIEKQQPTKNPANATGGTSLTDHVDDSDDDEDDSLCVICLDNARDCILQACGHWQLCMACADQCEVCPICREQITDRVLA